MVDTVGVGAKSVEIFMSQRVCTIRKHLKTRGENGLVSRYEPDSALGHSTSCSTGSRTEGAMVM